MVLRDDFRVAKGECDVYIKSGKKHIQVPGNLVKKLIAELQRHADSVETNFQEIHKKG